METRFFIGQVRYRLRGTLGPDKRCLDEVGNGYLPLSVCTLRNQDDENEAVIEGMGSVWDASSQPSRHPYFETGVEEAVIAWSAPQPWHAEAD